MYLTFVQGQPITLFGEDDEARSARLHEIEMKEPMEYIKDEYESFVLAISFESNY